MIGLNVWMNNTVDLVELWRAPKESWGDAKPARVVNPDYDPMVEGSTEFVEFRDVPMSARTTTPNTNDSFRERVASGYTMYLDQEQVSLLRAGDEVRFDLPGSGRVAYKLDGFRGGLLWGAVNPLSSFDAGQEVNIAFLKAEAT